MSTFRFYIDQKVTLWERNTYDIEADSYEEAVEKIKQEEQAPAYDEENGFRQCEVMYDTSTTLEPEENDWEPTREIIYEEIVPRVPLNRIQEKVIWQNCDPKSVGGWKPGGEV